MADRQIKPMVNARGSPLSKTELRAWYLYDWANSAYFQVIVAFLPVLLQRLAQEHAGFPDTCPNYVWNYNISQELFGEDVDMYINNNGDSCDDDCQLHNFSTYCKGAPDTAILCLEADGTTTKRLSVTFLGYQMDPTEYVLLFVAFSVLFQAFAFISLSAIGDYANLRKRVWVFSSVLASVMATLTVATTADIWWFGGVILVFGNVAFGVGVMMYNAFIPLLAEAHWKVRDLPEGEERNAAIDRVMNRISSRGYAYGFVGGFLAILLATPFILFIDNYSMGLRFAVCIGGVWWFCFQLYSFKHVQERPGPPLPGNYRFYITFSWMRFIKLLGRLGKVPGTLKLLLLWFCYSDGVSTMNNVAVLSLGIMFKFCYVPKEIVLLIMIYCTPIFASVGLYVVDRFVQSHPNIKTKSVVIVSIFIMAIIPGWGLVGFLSDDFGLHFGVEMIPMAVLFGFAIGILQAYSRSLFGQMVPTGHESQFFGLFEITDKGSSWLGPIIVSVLYKYTDDLRYALFYVFGMLVIPAILLTQLDVAHGIKCAQEYSKLYPIEDEENSTIHARKDHQARTSIEMGTAKAGTQSQAPSAVVPIRDAQMIEVARISYC